jgi:archaellum biogenesis ATPase FlaH
VDRIESVILAYLLCDAKYAEAVLPYIEPSFFHSRAESDLFAGIQEHFNKYASCPSRQELLVYIHQECRETGDDVIEVLDGLEADESVNMDWLMSKTEQFIAEKSEHNFVLDLIHRLDSGKPSPSPEEYAKATSFSFSNLKKQGHDFFGDCDLLYQHMTDENERFPFDVEELNRLTNGGVSRKTLNVILAPTNVGKSLMLCHLAAMYMRQGRKVLYITLEMSDKTTAQRITANMLDRDMNSLASMDSQEFTTRMAALRNNCAGELVIREFPALSVTVTNFRVLLGDLKRTKKFVPDIVMVDYLNLCGAASLPKSAKADLYHTVGTIAAELRGFAAEHDVALWTATQTNRSGFKSTELELEHTSESYAVNSNADLILGLSQDEKMPNARIIKLLKNRNDGISGSRKAVVGVDGGRMKMYDFDTSGQVKAAMTDIPTRKGYPATAKVNSRRPRFAIEDENLAEAV